MTGKRIEQLCQLIPTGSSFLGTLPHLNHLPSLPGNTQDRMNRWTFSINNPRFGWDLVNALVETRTGFPDAVHEETLRTAYMARTLGFSDRAVDYAYMFETQPQFSAQRSIIKSMVMANCSVSQIMRDMGGVIDMYVLVAWEDLFYNIRDRSREPGFLYGIVYPDGPVVEKDANYERLESLDMLVMRLAYHHGWEHTATWCGLTRRENVEMVDAVAAAQQVESAIMTNALLSIRTGGLNQPRNQAINQARQLIAAKLAGGEENNAASDLYGLSAIGAGNAALTELSRMDMDLDERLRTARSEEDANAAAEKKAAKSAFDAKIIKI